MGARSSCLLSPLADRLCVAAQVADSGVDLGQGQSHLRHSGSLSTTVVLDACRCWWADPDYPGIVLTLVVWGPVGVGATPEHAGGCEGRGKDPDGASPLRDLRPALRSGR